MYHTETLRQLTTEPKSIMFLIILSAMVCIAIAFGFGLFNRKKPEFAFSKRQITGVVVVSYITLFVGFLYHKGLVMERNQDVAIHYVNQLDENRHIQLIKQVDELPDGDYVKALVIQAEQYFK